MIQTQKEYRRMMDEDAESGMSMGYLISRVANYITAYEVDDWVPDFYKRNLIPTMESGK